MRKSSTDLAEPTTRVRLEIRDAEYGQISPARVEILDVDGNSIVPAGALPVSGQCGSLSHGGVNRLEGTVAMPASDTLQFYVAAPLEIELEPGRYRITVQKGIEFERQVLDVEIEDGYSRVLDIELSRWADMAAGQWFSSDAHLHIPRLAGNDEMLLDWMSAEDLNVANLLQMGNPDGVVVARQSSFGPASVVQRGATIIASGQENPRTWILGHGVVLGADSYIDLPQEYLDYQRLWERAIEQGGLVGYAHFFAPGVWVDAPTGAIDFLEVLQFGRAVPTGLYDLLSLGLRIAPTAGSDFPCPLSGPPGSERFYTRVEGPLTYESWLKGVREGRTFVTNGPLLDFSIDGVGIGDDLVLPAARGVRVRASVRFDSRWDDVSTVELVRAGEVIHAVTGPTEDGKTEFELDVSVEDSTWFALRSRGSATMRDDGAVRTAHSGAIFVEVVGSPGLASQESAVRVAGAGLVALDGLEERFSKEALRSIQTPLEEGFTGITAEIGLRDRDAVLDAINRARRFYENLTR